MTWLGIDTNSKLIYEGGSMAGASAVWPSPVVTPANFGLSGDAEFKIAKPSSSVVPGFLFREDSYDPSIRIRRGRFYKAQNTQPWHDWEIILTPPVHAYPNERIDGRPGLAKKDAFTFQSYSVSMEIRKAEGKQLLVLLGTGDAVTPWTVVNIETIHTGEELVTLKARQSLGALPEMDWNKVPEESRGKIREELDRLENEFRKAGPESVVDRAREAATAILNAWFHRNIPAKELASEKLNDLGPLIKFWEKHHKINQGRGVACAAASIAYAAEIPQRFHSRGKHMERERLNLRPLREQDAELAVLCIGTILCDLGWAEWR